MIQMCQYLKINSMDFFSTRWQLLLCLQCQLQYWSTVSSYSRLKYFFVSCLVFTFHQDILLQAYLYNTLGMLTIFSHSWFVKEWIALTNIKNDVWKDCNFENLQNVIEKSIYCLVLDMLYCNTVQCRQPSRRYILWNNDFIHN